MYKNFELYKNNINEALDNIDKNALANLLSGVFNLFSNNRPLLVCGNGGSAAISEHISCDFTKGTRISNSYITPFVIPLNSNVSLITAIANDLAYDKIYSSQIDWFNDSRAGVLVISSSGNSKNIINALHSANKRNMETFALVGFDGGQVLKEKLSNNILHINSNNYGVVEDCHQIICHYITQEIAQLNN